MKPIDEFTFYQKSALTRLYQISADTLQLTLRAPKLDAGRPYYSLKFNAPDTFTQSGYRSYLEFCLDDLREPGAMTNKVLERFGAHPFAGADTEADVAEANAVLTSTATRASKRKVRAGMEYFAWRHQYILHNMGDISAIWRWHLSLLIPFQPKRNSKSSSLPIPTLTVTLINAWQLVRADTPGQENLYKYLQDFLILAANKLAAEALESFELSLEQEDGLAHNLPVILKFAEAPQATHRAGFMAGLSAALSQDYWADHLLSEIWDDGPQYLDIVKVSAAPLMPAELPAILSTQRRDRPLVTDKGAPGETYLLVEGAIPELLLTDSGRIYPEYMQQRHAQLVDVYRQTPRSLLKEFGCDTVEFNEFSPRVPCPRFVSELEHKMTQWLLTHDYAEDIEDPREIERLAADLAMAKENLGGVFAEEKLVVRLLIDKATNLSFAWVALADDTLSTFLERAMAGGTISPLSGPPSNLQVPAKYCSLHPEIAVWCEANSVTLTKPTSGFASGISFLKPWREAIRQLDCHKDAIRSPGHRLTVTMESELASLEEFQQQVEQQAWAPLIMGLRGFGYYSGRIVAAEQYFNAMRPGEDIAGLLQLKITEQESLQAGTKKAGGEP